ncbi:MAG: Ni/Fe-hydrogenase cytochrome b subunit [Thermoanaerobaculia bacterium]
MVRSDASAVGGPLMTRPFKVLLALGALGIVLIVWRFVVGLGAATALNDGYPWGIWIAFDVVTGTALACGGYAMALLVYIFNRGRYHPLVRPAILTSALGYTLAGLSIAIDVGRPWYLWKVPIQIWHWNVNSALLEVAVCIMAYIVVLWLELAPAFLEKWKDGEHEKKREFARKSLPILNGAMIWLVGLGILLPTMHQSSLGLLMLLGGPKLHPLWNTPFLPLFFLFTSLAVGYAAVIFESAFASLAFHRKPHVEMLTFLQRFAAMGSLLFVVFRFIDLVIRGRLGLAFQFEFYAILFWLENVLFLAPFLIAILARRRTIGGLFREAMLVAVAGTLYRFSTFLLAFDPGPSWAYFPSVGELFITVGLVALELAAYVFIVKTFPVLSGVPSLASQKAAPVAVTVAPTPAH